MSYFARLVPLSPLDWPTQAQPVAKIVGTFNSQIAKITSEVLPLISRGDSRKIEIVQGRLRTLVVRAVKAELARAFAEFGIEIFEVGRYEPKSFDDTVRPLLRSLISGLGLLTLRRKTTRDVSAVLPTSGACLDSIFVLAKRSRCLSEMCPLDGWSTAAR